MVSYCTHCVLHDMYPGTGIKTFSSRCWRHNMEDQQNHNHRSFHWVDATAAFYTPHATCIWVAISSSLILLLLLLAFAVLYCSLTQRANTTCKIM